ncbi:MAG: pteridine reductase [Colwellia sp. Phe_37]|nr:MAG: pteridine reductase [Cycloclasticus sp. Phe_18]KXJ52547.1 MAG: pteridine reductase [Colwellia sp. Phe_37]MEE4291478.1 pteridine reductase [Cycloclasticus sp.]
MSNLQKIVLITGAARRIGAQIAKIFHEAGYGVVLHYRDSRVEAEALMGLLNGKRKGSAWVVKADLQSVEQIQQMIEGLIDKTGRLDVLINNASTFYETPLGTAKEAEWDDLMGSNLKAPFFVSQAAFNELKKTKGCIVNLVDIYAKRSLSNYSIYSTAKAGLSALTESLAKELAPEVRVNGVSPGVILWPENQSLELGEEIVMRIPLQRQGSVDDIAETVLFLSKNAGYITGQVIAVDGGKSLV